MEIILFGILILIGTLAISLAIGTADRDTIVTRAALRQARHSDRV